MNYSFPDPNIPTRECRAVNSESIGKVVSFLNAACIAQQKQHWEILFVKGTSEHVIRSVLLAESNIEEMTQTEAPTTIPHQSLRSFGFWA